MFHANQQQHFALSACSHTKTWKTMKNNASLVCTHPMTLVSVIALATLFLLHWELFLVVLLILILSMDDCLGGVVVVVL
jgi:ABC-type bacteriocin/lantibiotic exporter with double-glycine peptidase domain